MITPELKRLVLDEASKLREHATPEELGRLDFHRLNPNKPYTCIYGQMTGDCHHPRAIYLMNESCLPYSEVVSEDDVIDPREGNSDDFDNGYQRAFTPIEFYICREDAKNETLIKYLKGEIQELREEDL